MTVIYVDTLFLLNGVVDYLLLLAAARLAGEPLRRWRFALGAALGGLYAVAIFLPGLSFLAHPLCRAASMLLMLLLAYGGSRRLLRQGVLFVALTCAFGGGVVAIGLLGGTGLSLGGGVFYSALDLKMVLLSAAVCYGVITLVLQRVGKHSSAAGELVRARLRLGERQGGHTPLQDTRNNLTRPGTGRPVLVGISLDFRPGEVLAVIGPNGCGKSTLLRAANGLLPRTGGDVLLDGIPLERLSARETAQKVAYLPQSRSVPNITAGRMVLHGRFPYLSYPRRYRREDHEMVKRTLAWVGASDLASRPLAELSGGQRQKVYLAMALAQDTETILMDEPTTYLDVGCQLEVMALARRLAEEGRAVVMVLHDLTLALRCAHRAALLHEGRVRQLGTPEELYRGEALEQVMGVTLGRVETAEGWRYFYR